MLDAIKYYTVRDMKKLYSIASEAEKTRQDDLERCSTALASLLFATIECLGVLLNNQITIDTHYHYSDKKNAQKDEYFFFDGRKNVDIFFREVNLLGMEDISQPDLTIVSLTMRNGFIHSLFPKLGMGVAFNLEDEYRREILTEIDDNLSLNVAYLTNYVLRSIELVVLKYESDDAFRKMIEQNGQWYKEKQEKNIKKDKNDELKNALQNYPKVLKRHFSI